MLFRILTLPCTSIKKHGTAHYNRGNSYQAIGSYKKAIKDYLIALQINASNVDAHFELGNVYVSLGKYSEAIASFDSAIGLKGDYSKVYIARGVAKIKTGEHDEGCNDLTKANELGDKGVHAMLKIYCEK